MSKKLIFSGTYGSSERTSDGSSHGTFFSQLRHIAGEVDRGVQYIQQEVDSRKTRQVSTDEHATAINFLLHSKKEITDLKNKAQADNIDFTLRSSSFARIQELMKNVLAVQTERLENVECFIEKYGYTRPNFQKPENTDKACAGRLEENGSGNAHTSEAQLKTENEESDNSAVILENDGEDENVLTPQRHHEQKKSMEQNRMRTPRLEDLYSHLSEDTVMLFKHGPNSFQTEKNPSPKKFDSSDFFSNNWTTSTTANTTEIRTPDIPNLKTSGFSLTKPTETPGNTREMGTNHVMTPEAPTLHTPGFKLNNSSKANTTSLNETPGLVYNRPGGETTELIQETPLEPPKLLTPGLKLNCFANVEPEKKELKSARSLINFDTPPVPELRTCVLSERDLSNYGMVVDNKENEPKTKALLISTPEPPKLMTRGFTLSGYFDSKSDFK